MSFVDIIMILFTRSPRKTQDVEHMDRESKVKVAEAHDAIAELLGELMYERKVDMIRKGWEKNSNDQP